MFIQLRIILGLNKPRELFIRWHNPALPFRLRNGKPYPSSLVYLLHISYDLLIKFCYYLFFRFTSFLYLIITIDVTA